jgi:hypothetical protein
MNSKIEAVAGDYKLIYYCTCGYSDNQQTCTYSNKTEVVKEEK